jgi:hypothetical protein
MFGVSDSVEWLTFGQRRIHMRLLRIASIVLASSLSLFASDSPFSGTWKLNVEKSKMSPPSPQAEIVRVDADDNGIKVVDDVTDSKGQPLKVSYEAKFDGKDYPATSPDFDAVAFQRINNHRLKAKAKKSGKVIAEYAIAVSADGKMTTVEYTETGPDGKKIKGSAVYDKQ